MSHISDREWGNIRRFFFNASHITSSLRRSTPYCAIASINDDGSPRLAPISSLILGEDKRGFYFEQFSQNMSSNLQRDQRVCVLIVENRNWFWKKAVFLGQYDHPPAIRLFGTVSEKREATQLELNAYRKPIKKFRFFKGYQPLWGVMKKGREIMFDSFATVECGGIKEKMSIV